MNLGSPNDVGLVWMSDMLLPSAAMSPDTLMIGSDHRHPFFHAADLTHAQPLFLQDVNSMMYMDEVEDGMSSALEDDFLAKEAALQAAGLQIAALQAPQCGGVTLPQISGALTPPKRNLSPSQPQSKKIKAVKHPGLKLQTPIAYQRDTDINVIPIQRDGMGVCEKCGAIGVKHAFYTRERNYCSLACARTERSNSQNQQQHQDAQAQLNVDSNSSWGSETPSFSLGDVMTWNRNQSDNSLDATPIQPPQTVNHINASNGPMVIPNQLVAASRPSPLTHSFAAIGSPVNTTATLPLTTSRVDLNTISDLSSQLVEDELQFPPDPSNLPHLASSFSWDMMLFSPDFHAAPVSNFYHAPMADCWDNITVGMKIEVENTDCDDPDSFWVASVMQIAGYKALLRYEGFGQNSSRDFWVNLCSSKVHPVGWCASRAKPLIPPKTIEDKYKDWKHFLVKRLTGARTLPSNFCSKVQDSLKSRFRCDLNLEVVDKNRISQVKVATIVQIVGKRLHVKYYHADPLDNGFWAHEDSPLLHPVGWARRIGQDLAAPSSYVDRCLKGLRDKDDATQDLFPLSNSLAYHTGFRTGMKLEAVDPLNLSSICVATIMKVLNEGYLLVRIESYDDDPNSPGSDWFCYHSTSACILPPGFCEIHNLELTPPSGYSHFTWTDYLATTNSHPAPAELFDLEPAEHNFAVGQKIEAADVMDPRLICVATISMIVGRLLKVHFDGWEEEYDQWVDVHSCDLYPVGWAELVSHKLEGPPSQLKPLQKSKGEKHRRKLRRGGKTSGGCRVGGRVSVEQNSLGHTAAPGHPHLPSGQLVDVSTRVADEPSGPDQSLPDSHLHLNTATVVDIIKTLPEIDCNDTFPEIDAQNSMELKISAATVQHEDLINHRDVRKKTCNTYGILKDSSPLKSGNHPHPTAVATVAPLSPSDNTLLSPAMWTPDEVAEFLNSNNCSAYTPSFTQQGITGRKLLDLTKDEIIALTGKVGPSLKIYDLIQQLKVNHKHERHKTTHKII